MQLTGVKAGSLLVAYVKWEGTSASTVTLSDGTSTFTADTLNSAANNDLNGRFYLPAGVDRFGHGDLHGDMERRRARTASCCCLRVQLQRGTVELRRIESGDGDVGDANSGNITTTGTDEVVFGAYGEYSERNDCNGAHQRGGGRSGPAQRLRLDVEQDVHRHRSPVRRRPAATARRGWAT